MDNTGGRDPYSYQGTDVLINKLDIRDPNELSLADADLAYYRLDEMYGHLMCDSFS